MLVTRCLATLANSRDVGEDGPLFSALVEDDCRAGNALVPEGDTIGVKVKSSTRTSKNVGIPGEMFGLVEWAAGDEGTRAYISPLLQRRTRCMGAVLVAALEAHGCRRKPDGTYEHTDNPQFNRFERLRIELQSTHAVATQALKEGLAAQLTRISSLENQLTCAQAKGDEAHEALTQLQAKLSPALEKASEAEARAAAAQAAAELAESRANTAESTQQQLTQEVERFRAFPNYRALHVELGKAKDALAPVEGAKIKLASKHIAAHMHGGSSAQRAGGITWAAGSAAYMHAEVGEGAGGGTC